MRIQLLRALALILAAGCAPAKKVVVAPKSEQRKAIKPAQSVQEIQAAFDVGVAALNASPADLETARQGFEAALKAAPTFAEAHYNLAFVLKGSGDEVGAERELKTALGMMPNGGQRAAKLALAELYLGDEKRLAEAETMLQQLLVANPEDLSVKHNLAALYRRQKDYDTSVKFLREILGREAKNLAALNTLGLVYLDQGNLPMAEWILGKAMKYSEKAPNADILNNMGLVALAKDDRPLAVNYFQRAAKASPTNVPSRLNAGAVYVNYLNYAGAADVYTTVIALRPRHLEARLGLGASLFGLQQYDKAAEEYKRVVELDNRDGTAYHRLGRLYEEFLRDPEQALKYYKDYIRVTNPPADDPILQQIQFLEQTIKSGMLRAPEPEPERPKKPLVGAAATGLEGVSIEEALRADPNAPPPDPNAAPADPNAPPVPPAAAPPAAAAPAEAAPAEAAPAEAAPAAAPDKGGK